jgi:hypothetical protein
LLRSSSDTRRPRRRPSCASSRRFVGWAELARLRLWASKTHGPPMNAAPSAASFGHLLGLSFFSRPGVRGFLRSGYNETARRDSNVPDAGFRRRHALPL